MVRDVVTPVDRLLRRTLVRSENNWATAKTVCFYAFLFLLVCLTSCTKVINVKLNEADKQLVIEGIVPYGDSGFLWLEPVYPQVKISETKSFEDSNSFIGVSGATVSITVNGATTYQMFEGKDTGIYESRQGDFLGHPGNTYQLTVTFNGKTYTATSTMPSQLVPLDSIWAESLTFAGKTNYTIYPSYKDPPGLGNSYRLVEYQNGVQVKHVFEQNDELSDGLIITRPLINPDGTLARGDLVRVDLQCIDANVYKYWFSLDQSATGENQSATPANPVSNIEGGALGYFSAYSTTWRTIQIP